MPALTLIQPKPRIVEIIEPREKTPESILEIKRIIEGDPSEIDQQVAFIHSLNTSTASLIEYNENSSQEEDETQNESQSSSHSLLCDEIIDSVTPESEKNKSTSAVEQAVTPAKSATTADETTSPSAVDDVKKNLGKMLVKSEAMKVEPDGESKMQLADFEELLETFGKRETTDENTMVEILPQVKSKRARKPKHLPYKPLMPNRRSKSEMKLELELDFHDPINHIQWDDGVGGLDNCNKLFGFDEFGLVEVLDKKDLLAKFRDNIDWQEVQCRAKLKKITDPEDKFTCTVCNKHGTIRDFFSPETCSEVCLAIMKKKAQYDVS